MPLSAWVLAGAVWATGALTLAAIDERGATKHWQERLPAVVVIGWPVLLVSALLAAVVVVPFMVPVWTGRWIARRVAAREEARDA